MVYPMRMIERGGIHTQMPRVPSFTKTILSTDFTGISGPFASIRILCQSTWRFTYVWNLRILLTHTA
jgi:hypothetical protein